MSDVTPADLDWEYDPEQTPGANVRAMLRAADDAGLTGADAKDFAFRHIPAAGPRLVERNLDHLGDEVDLVAHNAADFM